MGEIVRYFEERARIAANTLIIFSAKGCILVSAIGKTVTNKSKLFYIISIDMKMID